MNIALKRIVAFAGANGRVPACALRRLVLLTLFAGVGMSGAMAGPRERGERLDHPQQREQRAQMRAELRAERAAMQAGQRAPEQAGADEERRAGQAQPEQNWRAHNRLTPDERRDLRRQINEAGQDIYNKDKAARR
jgi:hypothetical protein